MGVKFKKRMLGIGLLELMLSLAIIAVLLIMATRYYSSASESQKIQAGVDMVNAVRAAVANYSSGQGIPTTPPTVLELVQSGLLPASFGSTAALNGTANPWGESIATAASSTSGAYEVTMTTPSSNICTAVQGKLAATAPQDSDVSCSSGSTVTATYYY